MKVNKSLLAVLSMVLILLLFVSSASAADTNETSDVLSIDESVNLENNNTLALDAASNDNNAVESNANVLKDDNTGTYSELAEEIGDGHDVVLSKSLYTYDFGETIYIRNKCTIDGNGAIIDMAGSNFRLFTIYGECVIKNLTIKNVNCNEEGGAIYFGTTDCSAINCNFINNTAKEGGAIFAMGTMHIVSNCNFINNTAENGGAIASGGLYDPITYCAFVNNSANKGNAFFDEYPANLENNWWGSNNPNWNELISNGQIPSVYAVLNVTADPTEIDTSEQSNITTKFVWNGTNTDATNSLPKRNVKLSSNGTLNETEGTVGLTSQFSATTGGIYYVNATVDNETIGVNVKVTGAGPTPVTDTWYVNSSATGGDGKTPETAFKTLNDALTNSELQDGNTIMIASGEYKGENNTGLTIDKNLNFLKYGDGEAIFDAENQRQIWKVTATSINITGLTFKNGKADVGGAISIENRLSNSNINATFIGNKAERMGGAIYDRYAVTGNLTGIFINNTASNGGAINCYGLFDNLTGIFINNTASNGGAISIGNTGILGNLNGIFINNKAEMNGGAIYIDATDVSGNLTGIFINNEAKNNGGAVYIEISEYYEISGNLTGTYINNTANKGGAIYTGGYGLSDTVIRDSIFINNGNDTFKIGSGRSTATNCWFGNNATNYNIAPENIGNVIITDWLFLNATANPTEINVGESSTITFELDSYNDTSKDVTPYDASKMDAILELSQTLGEVNKNITLIGEEVIYTAKQEGTGSVTGKFVTAYYTVNLKNNGTGPTPIPTEIIVNPTSLDLTVGETGTINATLNPPEAGELTVDYDTKMLKVEQAADTGEWIVAALAEGKTNITFSFPGSGQYAPAENRTVTVTVSDKPTPSINVVAENLTKYYGGDEQFIVNVTDNTGKGIPDKNASITINGITYNKTTDANGIARLDINLPSGNYTASVIVDSITVNATVTVLLTIAGPDIISESRYVTYNAWLVDSEGESLENGTMVKFNINGIIYQSPVINDTASVDLILNSGNYTITATNPKTKEEFSNQITINAKDPSITVTAPPITVGENATVTVTLNNDATGNVTIKDMVITVNNGTASVILTDLPVGDTTVPVIYSGDDKYNNVSTNVTITVNPAPGPDRKNLTIKADASLIHAGENATVVVTGLENATGEVTVIINGKEYNGKINDGTADIIISGLTESVTGDVNYKGDENYNPASTTVKIAVIPELEVIIVADDVVKYYGGSERFVANVYDFAMNPIANKSVSIKINGIAYARTTDSNGTVSIAIRLGSGTYNVTTTVDNTTKESMVSVLSTIDGADITKYYKNDTQYSVLVCDATGKTVGEGKVVTFNVNGRFYNRTTDENGIATLTINLPPGEYIITATNPVTGEMQANNIKVLPVLSANDLKMKYLDGSQFKANLVDGQGKPYAEQTIQFNVNGILYNRVTDGNGQAALNIRLIPGEYIITSTFNGCNVANKITIIG